MVEANLSGDLAVVTGILDEAEEAQNDGQIQRALELYLEAAASTELPTGEICLNIARCDGLLGSTDEAFAWLARFVDVSDVFLHWSSAASLLRRLTKQARPMVGTSCRVALTGSYTTTQLAAMLPLAALRFGVDIVVDEGLYAQYQQDLIDASSALYGSKPDLIVLAVHEGALQLPSFSETPNVDVAAELERWKELWDVAFSRSSADVIQHNFAVRPEAPLGHLSAEIAGSRYAMIAALNRELHSAASDRVSIVDCDRLAANFGRLRWFDDRYWFRSKQAVALEAVPTLARHTAAVIAARLGLSRKCLVPRQLSRHAWRQERPFRCLPSCRTSRSRVL